MDIYSILELIGFIGATLTTIAFLPQVTKSLRTKRTKDLSYGFLIMQFTGCSLWFIYGLGITARPLIIANLITLTLLTFLMILKYKFDNQSRDR